MEDLRNPVVTRAAAIEAANRLQKLANMLQDDPILERIISEANRAICRNLDESSKAIKADTYDHPSQVEASMMRKGRLASQRH